MIGARTKKNENKGIGLVNNKTDKHNNTNEGQQSIFFSFGELFFLLRVFFYQFAFLTAQRGSLTMARRASFAQLGAFASRLSDFSDRKQSLCFGQWARIGRWPRRSSRDAWEFE